MLIGNYNILNKSAAKFTGGGVLCGTRANWSNNGDVRAFLNELPISAIPNGCTPPFSWGIARKSGGLACYTGASGSGAVSDLNLAGGLNAESDLAGTGDITLAEVLYAIVANAALTGTGDLSSSIGGTIPASADLTGSGDILAEIAAAVAMSADLAGSGELNGDIAGALQAVADLLGSGEFTAGITGSLNALADLTGTGEITDAQINAIWNMVAEILVAAELNGAMTGKGNIIATPQGDGSIEANPSAKAFMGSDITVTGDLLTTSNVGSAVWSAQAATNADSGSMGEQLTGAKSNTNIIPALI